MCDPAAIGPAVGAIGSAASASQANKEKKRIYEHKLKVRERKWMQTRTTYASKKVQFAQEVDFANIAAQRAYSKVQRKLYNARSLAILQNQEDFRKMLANEGMIEASAAERGVRGASVARQLVQNNANFGIAQALRSRGLREAGYDAREVYGDINRDLKGKLRQSFGRVAIQPIADLPPPRPVMQNVGLTLMLGMGEALGAGLSAGGGMNTPDYSNTRPPGAYGGASDIRLKENIEEIGVSPQGYKIYEFNYKGDDVRWRGAMAQDVRLKNPMAVGINVEHMYLTVDYDKIDIDMEVV